MYKPTINELLESVELAIMANGGFAHKLDWCRCDASVGAVPCEYCAIHSCLDRMFHYFTDRKNEIKNETKKT